MAKTAVSNHRGAGAVAQLLLYRRYCVGAVAVLVPFLLLFCFFPDVSRSGLQLQRQLRPLVQISSASKAIRRASSTDQRQPVAEIQTMNEDESSRSALATRSNDNDDNDDEDEDQSSEVAAPVGRKIAAARAELENSDDDEEDAPVGRKVGVQKMKTTKSRKPVLTKKKVNAIKGRNQEQQLDDLLINASDGANDLDMAASDSESSDDDDDQSAGLIEEETKTTIVMPEMCNLSIGEWVHDNTVGNHYMNLSSCSWTSSLPSGCKLTKKNLNWRWKPNECTLKEFEPTNFLSLMKNRSITFVGDDLAKAQMQSLLCLISQVELPKLIFDNKDNGSSRWYLEKWNITITMVWSPYWVHETIAWGYRRLTMNKLDVKWANMVQQTSVLVLASGVWAHDNVFMREPAAYVLHDNGVVVGCHHCEDLKDKLGDGIHIIDNKHINDTTNDTSNGVNRVKEMSPYTGFRATIRSCILGVRSLPGFTGLTLFVPPPPHIGYDNPHHNNNTNNVNTVTILEKFNMKLKSIQEDEIRKANLRLSVTNHSPMQVLDINLPHYDDRSSNKCLNSGMPPLHLLTWNHFLHHTLDVILNSNLS